MKKVLITGKNSYIGESLENYLHRVGGYEIDTLDMKAAEWKDYNFAGYDTIFHVAGIAHADTGHVSEERKTFYYKINTDLTIETAQMARSAGVKQFVFMSSMIIYGESAPIGKQKVITRETVPEPANFYGDSKLKADIAIRKLETDDFRVVVLRPPMIYGNGSKGNYPLLAKFAKKIPIFPKIKNERSMLYIDNLCEFVRLMIDNEERGIFFPQNGIYTNTSDMVKMIAKTSGRKIWLTSVFNVFLYMAARFPGKIGEIINKVFGNLVYEQSLSEYENGDYRVYSFENTIKATEVQK